MALRFQNFLGEHACSQTPYSLAPSALANVTPDLSLKSSRFQLVRRLGTLLCESVECAPQVLPKNQLINTFALITQTQTSKRKRWICIFFWNGYDEERWRLFFKNCTISSLLLKMIDPRRCMMIRNCRYGGFRRLRVRVVFDNNRVKIHDVWRFLYRYVERFLLQLCDWTISIPCFDSSGFFYLNGDVCIYQYGRCLSYR